MQLDPMDGPPGGGDGVGGWSTQTRSIVGAVTVVLLWILTTTALGAHLGSATALLAVVLVPGFLFRDYITPSHLPYVATFGAPVLLGGLWLS